METLLQKSNKNTVTNHCCDGQIVSNECSMCGDVGFPEKLFKCNSCLFRYQHTYCSSLYPRSQGDGLSCEWCICATKKRSPLQAAEGHGTDFDSISKRQSNPPGESAKKRGNSEEFVGVKDMRKPKLRLHAARRYKRLADF